MIRGRRRRAQPCDPPHEPRILASVRPVQLSSHAARSGPQEYTDNEHNPMIPHTLVLKPGLVIHAIYNGYWFRGRPSIFDLWRNLRTVTSEQDGAVG
jgi:hypothetical protein